MNKPEPTRIKLTPETPSTKKVNKIPLPALDKDYLYDIDMKNDIYSTLDNDNIYFAAKKKD
jgi:hypothetical protein